jgi:quercetin dioxygenase-like cupin family protein
MSDESERAANYVLGLSTGEERDAVARGIGTNPALASEVAYWSDQLAPLAGGDEIAPPPGLFERVQAAIASRSQLLPGTLTVRAQEGAWEPLSPGVDRKMLWDAGPNGRATFLVRMAPGARYAAHPHDDDEECYVVAGDVTFDTLTLRGGDYHLARRGVPHPAATSVTGCLLLITAAAA